MSINNKNLNNNTIDKILNTNKPKTSYQNNLNKFGYRSSDIDADFKQFGTNSTSSLPSKCDDHILANHTTMVNILEHKKKIPTEKGINIITKPEPVPYNMNMPEKITNMDPFAINRNLRPKGKYYTIRDEIDYYELEGVLKLMRTKYEFFKFENKYYKLNDIKYQIIELNTYVSQTLKYLLLNFLVDFNIQSKKNNIGSKYHQFTPYKIINVELMKLLYNKDLNIYRYILVCELYRKNKRNSINLYIEIVYKIDKDLVLYDKLYGIGFRNDEQIAFNKLANRGNDTHLSIHNFIDKNKDITILKSNDETTKILNNRESQYDLDNYLKHFQCINPNSLTGVDFDSITQSDCTSYSHQYKCPGKWDIPCTNNNECPFYMANKNYTNKRGGCNNGFCEMPVNVGSVGYHYMDKNQPICYNCEKIGKNKNCIGIKCNQCCEEQKNRNLYPKLETPDFAFKDDYTPRIANIDQLKLRNLKGDKML